jgi:hypothetical protein
MNDETRCRPIDRDLSDRWQLLADHIKDAQEGTADKDNYSKLLDNYTTETVTRMQQQKMEKQMADQRRMELSKSRQELEIQQTKQRAQLLHDAVEYLRQECVKRNKGEQQ